MKTTFCTQLGMLALVLLRGTAVEATQDPDEHCAPAPQEVSKQVNELGMQVADAFEGRLLELDSTHPNCEARGMVTKTQKGGISTYGRGDGLCGKPVAMQKPGGGHYNLDCTKRTAAHKTLPMGTTVWAHVGKHTVKVMINDRGPYHGNRILDVSPRAYDDLHFDGVSNVTIEYCVPKGSDSGSPERQPKAGRQKA